MKTLGLIGGTSWVSTVDYYSYINTLTNERLGGVSSANLLLHSLNMEDFVTFGKANDWNGLADYLSGIATQLQKAGAEAIVICANTPHIVADQVQQRLTIPIIHIAEVTAKEIVKQKINKVILLGTKFTMEKHFFKNILLKYDIETIIPDSKDREFIHDSIFTELGKGIIKAETKGKYLEIISKLQAEGAQGVILGCTEIPLLVKQEDCTIYAFDTALIHAKAAVDFAFSA